MTFMCPEKVLRFWDRLCSSPMSAKIRSNTLNRLSPETGTGIPDCTIIVSRPSVFRATVLPPVFGPVMTSVVDGPPIRISMGTHSIPGSRTRCGCLASESIVSSSSRPGMRPSSFTPKRAFASTRSISASILKLAAISCR